MTNSNDEQIPSEMVLSQNDQTTPAKTTPGDPVAILQRLEYTFIDADLLTAALTHRSSSTGAVENFAGEMDNQRLEFLGDSVLELVISEILYRHQPRLKEGDMSRVRAGLVCETRLAEVAQRIQVGKFLILGPGEASGGGRSKISVLADAVEALLGAIYLDGGLKAATEVALRLWKPYLSQPDSWSDMLADYKTKLQEETQSQGQGIPLYKLVSANGPAHARLFTMSILVEGVQLATAEAGSKKEAEQLAAQAALSLIKTRVDKTKGI